MFFWNLVINRTKWHELWRLRRADLAAISIFILYFAVFFGPIILAGKFFLFFDSYIEMYPERMTAWSMIRQGILPLWTPLLLSGYPLLSMAQIGLAYPLTWGYLFLPGHWAEEIFVLAPYLLCPLFTYAFCRELKRSRMAAILAALTYGYGGLMIINYTHNGLLTNSTMWTPLVLLAIDRSQNETLTRSWLLTTAAYSMSVFTGIGKGFLFGGLMAIAYALFLSLFRPSSTGALELTGKRLFSMDRWRPLIVAIAAIVTSAALGAFQILETMRAQQRSIRSSLSYEIFTQHSFTPRGLLKSFLAPIYIANTDLATAYLPPLAFLLAASAVVGMLAKRQPDRRVFFWLAIAMVGAVLMLGSYGPLYPWLYYVPVINKFRGAARHGYEWTFGIAMLSAYGWDAAVAKFAQERVVPRTRPYAVVIIVLLSTSLMVVILWLLSTQARISGIDLYQTLNISYPQYLLWKLAFTIPLLCAFWLILKVMPTGRRIGLAACLIAIACFVEPFLMVSKLWWPQAKPGSRMTTPTLATRFLQQFPPEQNRIYTRVHLDAEEYNPTPLFDSQNLTMLYGLHNVAGYEPLILSRYSRALGNAWLDGVGTRGEYNPDPTLFESNSHVLDLLNTTYTLTYENVLKIPESRLELDGIKFARYYDSFQLQPGEQSRVMPMLSASGDTLAIVSTLTYANELEQEQLVGRVRVFATNGEVIERELRAGVDSAEWAHERPDVRPVVRHRLASVFDRSGPDEPFVAYRYWTRIPLGKSVDVDRVEISNLAPGKTGLVIWNTVLYDSATSNSSLLQLSVFDKNKWRPVYNKSNVVIFHNERALPRAWLVTKAEAVDAEDALRRIRGESQRSFDPRQTALLEVSPAELPNFPGGVISAMATAKITAYEPNRLSIETNAETATVLVVSEMYYPGWQATVDGQAAPIHVADYLLRAIALPAGSHQVEMHYAAPAARNGALISLSTLLLLAGGVYTSNRKRSAKKRPG
jgi:hypothetical protein